MKIRALFLGLILPFAAGAAMRCDRPAPQLYSPVDNSDRQPATIAGALNEQTPYEAQSLAPPRHGRSLNTHGLGSAFAIGGGLTASLGVLFRASVINDQPKYGIDRSAYEEQLNVATAVIVVGAAFLVLGLILLIASQSH